MSNEWWGVICDVGVWGWVLSVVGFILGVFPARDRFDCNKALTWGTGFLFFYALWVVGMMHA